MIAWLNADDRYAPGALGRWERRSRATGSRMGQGLLPHHRANGEEIRGPVTAYKNFLLRT